MLQKHKQIFFPSRQVVKQHANRIQLLIDGPLVTVDSFTCRCNVLLSIMVVGVVGGGYCCFLTVGCWLQVIFRTIF
jgi:hypothetical protein